MGGHMSLEVGSVYDRYQVVRHLGDGGMASVYEVRHTTLGTSHALKVVAVHGAEVRGRLLQEGRVQAALRHPNILAVTDVIVVGDSPGLILDYVRGPSLADLLARRDLTADEADVLGRGILAGVAYAHRRGLVHRDLKPDNVLCAVAEDGKVVPKIADFGLVKALGEQGGSLGKTRTGQLLGTPYYMSPEQVRDSKGVDHRADIWALGALLFELLTGAVAFQNTDIFEVFSSVTRADYTWPEGKVAALPARLVAAVDACLHIDPDERVQSCDALLELWQGGTPEPEVHWDPGLFGTFASQDGHLAFTGSTLGLPSQDDPPFLATGSVADFGPSSALMTATGTRSNKRGLVAFLVLGSASMVGMLLAAGLLWSSFQPVGGGETGLAPPADTADQDTGSPDRPPAPPEGVVPQPAPEPEPEPPPEPVQLIRPDGGPPAEPAPRPAKPPPGKGDPLHPPLRPPPRGDLPPPPRGDLAPPPPRR